MSSSPAMKSFNALGAVQDASAPAEGVDCLLHSVCVRAQASLSQARVCGDWLQRLRSLLDARYVSSCRAEHAHTCSSIGSCCFLWPPVAEATLPHCCPCPAKYYLPPHSVPKRKHPPPPPPWQWPSIPMPGLHGAYAGCLGGK